MDNKYRPRISRQPSGTICYTCRVCNSAVGIYAPKDFHVRKGWLYKREECVNGHKVAWEDIDVLYTDNYTDK